MLRRCATSWCSRCDARRIRNNERVDVKVRCDD
jgi:hypothetical protein